MKGYRFKYGQHEFTIPYNMLADVQTEHMGSTGRTNLRVKIVMFADSAITVEMDNLLPGDKDYVD